MKLVRRVKTNLTRQMGKTLLLTLLCFLIGSLITTALLLDNSMTNTDENLRRGMRPIVQIEPDTQELRRVDELTGQTPEIAPLTAELMRQIGALEYVSHFEYTTELTVSSFSLVRYTPMIDGLPLFGSAEDEVHYFNLKGVSHAELIDVREGFITLVDGNSFTEQEVETGAPVAIVAAGFAEINGLSIGSFLEFDQFVTFEWDNYEAENVFAHRSILLEVVGIFDVEGEWLGDEGFADIDMDVVSRRINLGMRIYTPHAVAEGAVRFMQENTHLLFEENGLEGGGTWGNLEDELHVWNVLVLKDPMQIEAFRTEVEDLLPEFYHVTDLSHAFAEIAAPMAYLRELSALVLWGSMGFGMLILGFLMLLFLHERRHEIGVYLALGERRMKVIVQILCEVLLVATVGMTLAFFVGRLTASTLSSWALRNQLSQNQEIQEPVGHELFLMGLDESMTHDEMLANHDLHIDGRTVFIFYATSLGTVTFSTVLPVLYVLRLKPKDILMKASIG